MKRTIVIILVTAVIMPLAVLGEPLQRPAEIQRPTPAPASFPPPAPPPPAQDALPTRFNLNFPGGDPNALVVAIEKATGKPLNAIVPSDCTNIDIPPLKMSGVTVEELFKALQMASIKRVKL